MLERVLELLAPAVEGRPAIVVDATVGLGGHAAALLAEHPQLTLIGLDRDEEALRRSAQRLSSYGQRVRLVHAVYDEMPEVLARLGLTAGPGPDPSTSPVASAGTAATDAAGLGGRARVDAVLFDLGVSSLQLDDPARGFAYAHDAGLDMRMDSSRGVTAADVVNTYSAEELTRVLRDFGEERFAARIAAAIVRRRARGPLASTAGLAELVRDAIPAATRRTGGHPAKRTFQALRIEVNGELTALAAALPAAIDALRVGGRIVVLSYHSLEDRLVKRAVAAGARSTTPAGLPVELPGHEPVLRLLTRGAETPSPAEVERNPRAASARLRAAERLRDAA